MVNGCPLCLAAEETANHLLIRCSFAPKIWAAIFEKFRISWVEPHTVHELFGQWNIQ